MSKIITTEHFNTIYEFLKVSKSRPISKTMGSCNSSEEESRDSSWYGTRNYEEAEEIFRNGYTDILQRVLDGVAKSEKINAELSNVPKMIPRNRIIGYAPNVPNAIMGIPESMINVDRTNTKVKTINILYSSSVNCNITCEEIIKAGIAFITAVKIIESGGVFVNLDCSGLVTESGDEYAMATIKLKSYHERLDIQKLCFPLANPAMERRFGFKWLETVPTLVNKSFRGGYGHSLEKPDIIAKKFELRPEVRVINAYWIMAHNYDVNEIIKYLKNDLK